MATWDEIQAHVRSSYKLQRDEPRAFQMAFQIEAAGPGPAPSKPAPSKPSTSKPAPSERAAAPARAADPSRGGPSSAQTVQTVHGQLLTGLERSLLVLRSEICGERALSPVAALQAGAKLALGGLILSGGRYQLRCALPTESLQLADLDFALRYLVREAAELRQRTMQRVSLRGEERAPGLSPDLEGLAHAMQLNVLPTAPQGEREPATSPSKKPESK
jgi:hypothetical protein